MPKCWYIDVLLLSDLVIATACEHNLSTLLHGLNGTNGCKVTCYIGGQLAAILHNKLLCLLDWVFGIVLHGLWQLHFYNIELCFCLLDWFSEGVTL